MTPRHLGTATLAVLRAVADGVAYGFDIIDETGLPSGTVYPALASLERRELVESRWEDEDEARARGRPRRRYYRLTPAGAEALEEAVRRLESLGLRNPPESPETA
jgi:DNA-binding PadR family transcriptional regulator